MPEPRRRRPLEVGILVPQGEFRWNGRLPRWTDLRAMARLAEDIGLDSLWVVDHLLYRTPDGEPEGIWECWSLLSAFAAVTERITLGTLVVCTNWRNPALIAKMAETVDEISGGRLILGLGAGNTEHEFRRFGFPWERRVSRFAEALHIIHGLLRNGWIDFSGSSTLSVTVSCARVVRAQKARRSSSVVMDQGFYAWLHATRIFGTPITTSLGIARLVLVHSWRHSGLRAWPRGGIRAR